MQAPAIHARQIEELAPQLENEPQPLNQTLFQAIFNNNRGLVRQLIEHGADLNQRQREPYQRATSWGGVVRNAPEYDPMLGRLPALTPDELADLLAELREHRLPDQPQEGLMHVEADDVVVVGHPNLIRQILENGANPNQPQREQGHIDPIMYGPPGVGNGRIAQLIEQGANLNQPQRDNREALIQPLIHRADREIMELIMDRYVNANQPEQHPSRIEQLHAADVAGRREFARLYAMHQANIRAAQEARRNANQPAQAPQGPEAPGQQGRPATKRPHGF